MKAKIVSTTELLVTAVLAAISFGALAYALYHCHGELERDRSLFPVLGFSLVIAGTLVWVFAFRTYPPFRIPPPQPKKHAWRWVVPLLASSGLCTAGLILFVVGLLRGSGLSNIRVLDGIMVFGGALVFSLVCALLGKAVEKELRWWVAPLVIIATLLAIAAVTMYFAWFAGN